MAVNHPSMLQCLSSEKFWVDKHLYANAEKNYQIQLAKNSFVCTRAMEESENSPSISAVDKNTQRRRSEGSPSKERISSEDQYGNEIEKDLKSTVSMKDSEKSLEINQDNVDSTTTKQENTQENVETDLLRDENKGDATTQIIVTDHDDNVMKPTAGPVSKQEEENLSDAQTPFVAESTPPVLESVEKSDLSEEIQDKNINVASDSELDNVKTTDADQLQTESPSVEETVPGEEENTVPISTDFEKATVVAIQDVATKTNENNVQRPFTDSSSELRDEDSNSGNTIKSDESIASTSYSKINGEKKLADDQLQEPIASSSGTNARNDNKRPNMRFYENGRQKNGNGGQSNNTRYQHQENISSEDKDNTRQRRNMKQWHKRRYRQPNNENAENTNCEGSNVTKNNTAVPQSHAPARQWRNNRHRGGFDIEKLNTEIMNLKKTLATQARDIKQALTKEFEQKLSIQETMWKNHMHRTDADLREVKDSQEDKFKDLVTATADIRRVENEFRAHKNEYRGIIREDVTKMLLEHKMEIHTRLQQHEEVVNRMVESRIRSFELEQLNNQRMRQF